MQVKANGLRIEVDDQGPREGPAMLLVMGLGMQLIAWPQTLVQMLVDRGFRVIRFDNRDIGLSQGFDHAGIPNMALAGLRHALRLPVRSPYTLGDMAQDALGVLDALGVSRAHVCGASMGGMIAQRMAVLAPARVASLTLMMTSSGARHLPQAPWHLQRTLMLRPMGHSVDAAVEWVLRVLEAIGSPAYPTDPQSRGQRVLASVQRAWNPGGSVRQLLAVAADGDRSPLLPRIVQPTLVIHGTDDPLVPLACGEDLARRIPGARTDFIAGMGHDLPDALLARFAKGMADNAARDSG